MKKEDLLHPIFPKFIQHSEDVGYTGEIEHLWNTFKAGYDAAHAEADGVEKELLETPHQFDFTCARCPDPKHPTPEYHNTGHAHIGPVARPLPPKEQNRCRLPPEGWKCTREKGHTGPCATVTDNDRFVNGQP